MTLRATESSRRYNAIHDIRGQPLQPKSPACLLIHLQLLCIPTDCRDQLIEFLVDSLGIQYQYSTTQPQCNNWFQVIISAEARWMRTEPVPVPSQSEAPLSLRHPPACQHPSGTGYLVQVAIVASSPRKCPWGHQVFDVQSIRASQAARFQNHKISIYRYLILLHV